MPRRGSGGSSSRGFVIRNGTPTCCSPSCGAGTRWVCAVSNTGRKYTMGKFWKLAAAVALALSLGTADARAAIGLSSPVRVLTLGPAERQNEGPAPRQLLADRL